MKWPDGTWDIVEAQSHTRACQLYTKAHAVERAIAASDRQWGIFVEQVDQHIFYFYSQHNFDNVSFFHDQGATGGFMKPVSQMPKLCPNPQNKSKPNWTRLTDAYLYCWWSLVLRVFAMKRSASFSRFLEYSISISDFFLKKSWRSCSSWTLMSVCWSKHFCCSTSWARISGRTQGRKQIRMMLHPLGTCTEC